jgi:tetratricopeptide (TPR) repeat protein
MAQEVIILKIILAIAAIMMVVGLTQAATITVCPSGCDYKSVQAAVYAAKPNDTITLHSGTYNESVFLTKELKFIGNDTGKGEPVVTGDLYLGGFRYSLSGFGFNSVQNSPNAYSSASDSIYYWMAKASEYMATKTYSKALEASSNALKIDPQNVLALNQKGNALNDQGRTNEAIGYYDQALNVDSSSSVSWANKASALYNLLNYEQALACYDHAISADPRDTSYLVGKANCLIRLAKYDDALTAANKAIEISPLTSINWEVKAVVLSRMAKYDDAITAINKAIDLNPNEGANWQVKGSILRLQGNNQDADAALAKARELGYSG